MKRRGSLLVIAIGIAIVIAVAAGCYSGPGADLGPPTQGPGSSSDGLPSRTSGDGADSGAASLAARGVPCDVARVLATSCTDCHGATPSGGASVSLVTYDDLTAPSTSEPSRSLAALSVERIRDAKRPMPPDDTLPASDLAVLERWVDAGLPRNVAVCSDDAVDGGREVDPSGDGTTTPADAATGAVPDASSGPESVCTSGTSWPQGAPASALMHPGQACLACHASQASGPALAVAGTVYPTLHEPNDCNGGANASASASLRVVLVDGLGKTHSLPVNDAGNFMRATAVPVPYRAMVVDGTKVREMKTPQTNGDCNGCHTEAGKLAPGRVMAP